MSWLDLKVLLVDAAMGIAEFAANWLLQSTLLIGVGLALGVCLRNRGSAVASVVYRTTLVALLVCPFATWGLSQAGISGWSVKLPAGWSQQEVKRAVANIKMPGDTTPLEVAASRFVSEPEAESLIKFNNQPFDDLPFSEQLSNEAARANAGEFNRVPSANSLSIPAANVQEPVTPSREELMISRLGIVALIAVAFWCVASMVFLIRLALAWRCLARLRHSSIRAEDEILQLCRELAIKLKVPAPEVLRSPFLPSPCLAGLTQPAVLLPDFDMSMATRDVLVHELAHLKRHDCHWNLLRQLATAAFCFQPLLWKLSTLIEATAEEVCDDYVVALGGDRHEYADRLVKLAELSLAPIAAAGVGIVSLRSMLARRVTRIMDTSRLAATRVGNALLVMILLSGLIATALVGLVGIAPGASPAEEVDTTNKTPADKSDTVAQRSDDSENGDKVVRGQVTMPDGKPAVGAHVAVIANSMAPPRSGVYGPRIEILSEGLTDSLGNYQLKFRDASSKTHFYPHVIARQEGMAVAWQPINLDQRENERPLKLPAEETIRGRLVDSEGRPLARVWLWVHQIIERTNDGNSTDEWVNYDDRQKNLRAWLPEIVTDEEGKFAIQGVSRNHGVHLEVQGTDQCAPQDISLNTGLAEERGERDHTYRSLVRNVAAREEVVLPVAPVQIFEGLVTFEDTGQAVPGAHVSVWASQQQQYGSMTSVGGVTDNEGRYRIIAKPGIRFGVDVIAPQGTAYLSRMTTVPDQIHWQAGDRVKQVDISLLKGILVRGKVVDDSGAPVANASVFYKRETSTNPFSVEGIVTERAISEGDGTFEMAVIPGPGRLLVQDRLDRYVLQELSAGMLNGTSAGGERYYAHAVKKIDPKPGSDPLDVTLELARGATIRGEVVDEAGRAIEEMKIISRLNIFPGELQWRGDTLPIQGNQFEIAGIEANKTYPVHILAGERQLGATAILSADILHPKIVLEPCGEATVRFVDEDGKPVADYYPWVEIVVTPGGYFEDHSWARKWGSLRADADFMENVDRTNKSDRMTTDAEGVSHIAGLIPGATYRIRVSRDGSQRTAKTFEGEAGKIMDLGDIAVEK